MTDEALDTAEALGAREELEAIEDRPTGLERSVTGDERDHPAEPRGLTLRQLVLGMAGQPGVEDPSDLRVLRQELGEDPGVLFVALHSDRQGLDPAEREPAIHRTGDTAGRVLKEAQLLGERLVARSE